MSVQVFVCFAFFRLFTNGPARKGVFFFLNIEKVSELQLITQIGPLIVKVLN